MREFLHAADIGQSAVSAFEDVRQFFVVDAQECEHRGVQVMDVHFILDRVPTERGCGEVERQARTLENQRGVKSSPSDRGA